MSSVILITGAGTGIGRLAARALADAGHTLYATMRDPEGRNAAKAADLLDYAVERDVDLRVVGSTSSRRTPPTRRSRR